MRPLVGAPVEVAHAVKSRVVTRRWQLPLVLTAAVLPMLAAGCGSSSGSSGSPSATTRTTAAATTSTTPSTSVALNTTTTVGTLPFYEVTTGNVKGLGTVLVDGQGLTLYLFVPDKQSGTSTCYGRCAEGWPPLLLPNGVTTPVAGSGIKTSLLGTTRRTDGTTQLTYNKWPLYLWVGDSQPGQATGQALDNLGGLWYVLAPDGQTITTRV
jgi:predicted lipoprotein with Yx(FWY)xxD motif